MAKPTAQEVETFLVEKLKIPDWKSIFESSKLKLVEKIVLSFGHYIHFQNVTASSHPIPQRPLPTPKQSIDLVMRRGVGGCCIHHNFILQQILEFLGLDSFLVGADIPGFPDVPQCHVIVILRMNNDGPNPEIYALDVGYGRPILFLVPLHNLPFRGKTSGFNLEYRLNPDTGNYERILYDGCSVFGQLKEAEGGKRVDYVFNLTPRPFSYFDQSMGKLFVDPASKFVASIFIYRLLSVKSKDDYEYVTIIRKTMMRGTLDTSQETTFDTYADMKPTILELFPNLDRDELDAAIANFEKFDKDKSLTLSMSFD